MLDANDDFFLRDRAAHVFEEAHRVDLFRDCCLAAAGELQGGAPVVEGREVAAESVAEALGALMNASHDSCHHLYDCSSPRLQQLVQVAREAGALGSRLTGAGWGGCTVSLVRAERAEEFMAAVRERFFEPLGLADKAGEGMFASLPAGGAAVLRLP